MQNSVAAGWLGSLIVRGGGLGLLGNSWVSAILTGAVGAVVILALFTLIFRKK
ncbi:MAG: hypothetical protein R6X09_04910 [Bacteroidales bacterium]